MLNFTAVSLLMTFSSVTAANVGDIHSTESIKVDEEEPPPSIILEIVQEVQRGGAGESKSNKPQITPSDIYTGEVSVEEYVRDYFSDIPIMAEIARCESTFRHFVGSNGEVLRGVVNSGDVGVMQINEKYHLSTANKLGKDIYSLEGNLAYARNLYQRQGVTPWLHSSKCWRGY